MMTSSDMHKVDNVGHTIIDSIFKYVGIYAVALAVVMSWLLCWW